MREIHATRNREDVAVFVKRHSSPTLDAACTCLAIKRTPSINRHVRPLTGRGLDLHGRALGSLLADNALGLSLGRRGRSLRLVFLLKSGLGRLLVLGVLDGSGAGSRSSLGSHGTTLLDDIEGSTDDSSLGLDGSAGSLLGGFL